MPQKTMRQGDLIAQLVNLQLVKQVAIHVQELLPNVLLPKLLFRLFVGLRACDVHQGNRALPPVSLVVQVTLQGVPDRPGLAASIFGRIAEAEICVDMIVQNVSHQDGRTNLTFTCDAKDLGDVTRRVDAIVADLGLEGSISSDHVAKVSVAGLGMRNHAGVAAKMFEVLAGEGINIQLISTSEIKISVVVDLDDVDRAVQALHRTFVTTDDAAAPARAG